MAYIAKVLPDKILIIDQTTGEVKNSLTGTGNSFPDISNLTFPEFDKKIQMQLFNVTSDMHPTAGGQPSYIRMQKGNLLAGAVQIPNNWVPGSQLRVSMLYHTANTTIAPIMFNVDTMCCYGTDRQIVFSDTTKTLAPGKVLQTMYEESVELFNHPAETVNPFLNITLERVDNVLYDAGAFYVHALFVTYVANKFDGTPIV
jgi:hypothetical protein